MKYGWPNDEVFNGHPYYDLGLKPYAFYEVINSDWIEEIKKRNSIHPRHSSELFEKDSHFIFYFHDSCFEIISKDFSIEVFKSRPLNDVAKEKSNDLFK